MSLLSLPVAERLNYLQELLSVNNKMYVWSYDSEGNLLDTNCPDMVLDSIFNSTGCRESVLEHAKVSRNPLVLGVLFGLLWSCSYEYQDERLLRIHVFGPVTTSELSYFEIRKKLQNDAITPKWRKKLVAILQRIPVASTIQFFQDTLMLHYCVTGEKLTTGEIAFETPKAPKNSSTDSTLKKDRLKTWMTEQALMGMISEGNLNYKNILHEASIVSSGVRAAEKDSLKHARLSAVVFVTLSTRAAITGGISPEVAYNRGDAYIRDILECRSVADAAQLSHSMYDDFIHSAK